MEDLLIIYLKKRLESNSTGNKNPEVAYEAAKIFHRKYPAISTAHDANEVELDCLSTCDQEYCQQKGYCYGGIFYINERNVQTASLNYATMFGDEEREKEIRKIIDAWKNIQLWNYLILKYFSNIAIK